ncbi:DUF6948 domain-containing protein [Neisseria sicca]|jgi:hypothetical protein|uniref:DUF6948 domain-containing protein n=1 Tax=Neisseria sicca TaxID=490 RepID=UPI000D30DBA7|nr:hypothetical protein [Neisseria sicca]DAX20427.1 MAG TPA: hypothetical protein [Caudoviricetes sp.]
MEVKKFEVKSPSDLLAMFVDILASAESKQQAEEEPLPPVTVTEAKGINDFAIGKEVIIRTYSAGVWFGVLSQKAGNEVILTKARRMYKWWAKESISLSGVARHGIKQEDSKICGELDSVWLEAIEIITVSGNAAESIRTALEVAQS